jgi:hypothetical protein
MAPHQRAVQVRRSGERWNGVELIDVQLEAGGEWIPAMNSLDVHQFRTPDMPLVEFNQSVGPAVLVDAAQWDQLFPGRRRRSGGTFVYRLARVQRYVAIDDDLVAKWCAETQAQIRHINDCLDALERHLCKIRQ